jgi:hypothetical protein
MTHTKQGSAKKVAITAISAALYAIFFLLSYSITTPNFTLLYLPIILLGIFPLWFGRAGLIGSMLGAFIGGVYVEALLPQAAWAESVVALIIYSLNWLLITKTAATARTLKGIITLACVYTLTLFVGTSYILWQLSILGIFPISVAEAFLLPTFALNLPIVVITCPLLIRAISPRLRTWGVYSGSFSEWLASKKPKTTEQ